MINKKKWASLSQDQKTRYTAIEEEAKLAIAEFHRVTEGCPESMKDEMLAEIFENLWNEKALLFQRFPEFDKLRLPLQKMIAATSEIFIK
jgi:hypothetical protein